MAEEIKRVVCEHCHARCRVLVYSDDGRLVKIEEDLNAFILEHVGPRI